MAQAQSVNDDLFDASVRHKVYLTRFENSVVKKILALLSKADLDLVNQIQKFDPNEVDGAWSKKRLEALLQAIREVSADAYRQVNGQLKSDLSGLAKYEAGFQANMLVTTIPVTMDIITPAAQQLVSAVTKDPIAGRLLKEWTDNLSANQYARVSQAIRLGFIEGQTTPQIIQRVRGTRALKFKDGVLETSKRSAEGLVRTAVASVADNTRQAVLKENSDIIRAEKFVATLDTKTCLRCSSLDGKEFPVGEGPSIPVHVNCRCTRIGIVKSFRDLGIDLDEATPGTRASMNGQVPASMTYEQWLKRQSADVQDDILGKTKGALFRRAKLPIEKFVNNGKEMNLDELRATESWAFKRAGVE